MDVKLPELHLLPLEEIAIEEFKLKSVNLRFELSKALTSIASVVLAASQLNLEVLQSLPADQHEQSTLIAQNNLENQKALTAIQLQMAEIQREIIQAI